MWKKVLVLLLFVGVVTCMTKDERDYQRRLDDFNQWRNEMEDRDRSINDRRQSRQGRFRGRRSPHLFRRFKRELENVVREEAGSGLGGYLRNYLGNSLNDLEIPSYLRGLYSRYDNNNGYDRSSSHNYGYGIESSESSYNGRLGNLLGQPLESNNPLEQLLGRRRRRQQRRLDADFEGEYIDGRYSNDRDGLDEYSKLYNNNNLNVDEREGTVALPVSYLRTLQRVLRPLYEETQNVHEQPLVVREGRANNQSRRSLRQYYWTFGDDNVMFPNGTVFENDGTRVDLEPVKLSGGEILYKGITYVLPNLL